MRTDRKPNIHNRPPHIVKENGYYFITGRTVDGQWYLRPNEYKQIFLNTLFEKTKKFEFPLIAYVVLQNHYHLIINVKDGSAVSTFMNQLHGSSSRALNNADAVLGRKVWWNYFEKLIASDKDFYCHLNYIHQNPIKHSLSKGFEYEFSSYDQWVEKRGKEYLDQCFEKYPIVDFKVLNDEF